MSTDRNLLSFVGPQDDGVLKTGLRLDGTGYTDALKCSNLRNAIFDGFEIVGGLEDTIDANRGGNLVWRNGKLFPKGQYACTIKGGIDGWLLEDVVIWGRGSVTEIDLGGWSDQASLFRQRTINGVMRRVRMSDGSAVRVRVLNGEKPKIEDCGPVNVTVVPRALLWFWWTLRARGWFAG